MNLKERIDALKLIGLTYDEQTRYFRGDAGKIDQDVVEYGNQELFNKHYLRCKIKFEKSCTPSKI